MQTITITIGGDGCAKVSQRGRAADDLKTKDVSAGQRLLVSGGDGSSAYIVRSGSVRLEKRSVAHIVREGAIIGEEALLGEPFDYTATALEDGVVEVVGRDFVEALGESGKRVVLALAESVRMARDESNEAHLDSNLKVRLAKHLINLAVEDGSELKGGWFRIERRITHKNLAEMIGSTRATVSVYLKDLRDNGLLRDEDGLIEIHKDGVRAFLVKE